MCLLLPFHQPPSLPNLVVRMSRAAGRGLLRPSRVFEFGAAHTPEYEGIEMRPPHRSSELAALAGVIMTAESTRSTLALAIRVKDG